MSRDSTYIFLWDANAPDGAASKALAEITSTGRAAAKTEILSNHILFWECEKHGLVLSHIPFGWEPDQVLESANGDPFRDVTSEMTAPQP